MARNLRRDFSFAIAGQATLVIAGIARTLLIPIMLGTNIQAYANWQTYLLYLGYISIGYWGFNDGFYVRHSREKYSSSKHILKSAFLVDALFLAAQAVALIGFAAVTGVFGADTMIWIAIFANLPLTGLYGMLVYHFQLTGRIDRASVIVTIDKIIFLVALAALFSTNTLSLHNLIFIEIGSKVLVATYAYWSEQRLFSGVRASWDLGIREFRSNVSVGIKLMLGAYFASLLVGVVRMFVQTTATPKEFAYYALAFSFAGVLFTLGAAVSVVLYPHLSENGVAAQGKHFLTIERLLRVIFPVLLLGYFPGAALIYLLLPQYGPSVRLLAFLLPAVGFQLIVGTLNGTYYKLLRHERHMLFDNASSLAVLVAVSFVLREHIIAMTIGQILVLAIRTWHTQRRFRTHLGLPPGYAFLGQLAWTAAFLTIVHLSNPWLAGMFVALVILRVVRGRAEVRDVYQRFLRPRGGRGPSS